MKSLLHFTKRFLRPSVRRMRVILYRMRGIRLGEGSSLQSPYKIMLPQFLSIGKETCIRPNSYILALEEYAGIEYRPHIMIGNNVYIGRYAYICAVDMINIDDGCVLSEYVYITDNVHGLHPDRGPIMEQHLESKGPVQIGHNSFLGYRATIMPGVTLGEHCVVGANAVVTRSFPAFSMVAGCPARLIKIFSRKAGDWVTV